MEKPRVIAIIPAGGQGKRMGSETPKQYLPLRGRPLLWHTLRCFEESRRVCGIVLVVRPEDVDYCSSQVLEGQNFHKVRELVPGGSARWESVSAGLQRTTPEDEIVLVHDAVRPFIADQLLGRIIEATIEHGAAIAGMPVKETVKVVKEGYIVQTPERATLWSAQTPQGFRRKLLLEAYAHMPDGGAVTDDAMLVENLGHPVWIVEGDYQNVKITTPDDLIWAEWHLAREEQMRAKRLRVGQGFDVHRLEEGRRLILGGVDIPFERGLAGHSDADVLSHAIIDALLGAVARGDIGRMFPDTDVQYEDISSLVLLGQVRQVLQEKGAEIVNIDALVIAQRPRLAPFIEGMSEAIAAVLQIETEALSLKATTTERLGFVGREEGIAAQAVALVEL